MEKFLSPLIGWVWIVGYSVMSLSGAHWVEHDWYYLSPSEGQPESSHLYDSRSAKSELRFPELNEGEVVGDAHHFYQLLPKDVKDWLLRLGTVASNRTQLRTRQKLSITCVVHQPCQEKTFAASERFWYCNGLPAGCAAILFIPLGQGQINFSIPADYSSNGLRRGSLPNGFVKRIFPFHQRNDVPNCFLTRISGADDHHPFGFASLVFYPKQKHVFVAIEIIPPFGAVLNDMGIINGLLKRFINACHPCW